MESVSKLEKNERKRIHKTCKSCEKKNTFTVRELMKFGGLIMD